MPSPRTSGRSLIIVILALVVAAFVGGPSSIAADAAGQRSGSSQAKSQAENAATHKSKKHKKHKKKKSKKSAKKKSVQKKSAKKKHRKKSAKKPKAAKRAAPKAVASRYAYNRLRNRFTFTGSKVDASRWGVYNTNGWWSKDKDARRPELVSVAKNTLRVTASGTKGSGLCVCKKSAKSTTPYGRYEIRARAQANRDHGFAILLWPNAEDWPAGGEIDIAEYDTARQKLWTTVHYSPKNKRYITQTRGDYTSWHTYGVEWTPKSITWYLDGKATMKVIDPAAIPRRPMHLVLQAGKMDGVTSPSNTSATLEVAWINEYV